VVQKGKNSLTPYILQIAIGMHAVFEGLSIGIESRAGACLGLALAVSCHKWVDIIDRCLG
jgi:zinc transporter 1/2/3